MNFLNVVKSGVGTVKNVTAEHSPQILLVTGIASIVGGMILTIKNNTKASDILVDRREAIDGLTELSEENKEIYTDEKLSSDIRKVNMSTTIGLVKTYAPGVLLAGLGIVEIILSNREMSHRYKDMASYAGSLAASFAAYRQRAKEIYGDDADDRIMYGIERKKVSVSEVDPETGEVKTKKEEVDIATNPFGVSRYAIYFDQDTTTEWDPNMDVNLGYVNGCMQQANDRLQYPYNTKHKKIVLLNEVYEMLGFPQTLEGSKVGWSLDSKNGDHQIIFNVQEVAREDFEGSDTYHRCLLIDFNVDGPVTDKMLSHNFNKQRALEMA